MTKTLEDELKEMEAKVASLEKQKAEAKSDEKKITIQKNIDAIKKEMNKVSPEDILVPDKKPKPTKWEKVMDDQVQAAQKAGKLYGFDPNKMIALIRK